jgi:transcriptional regulator with XRE-family HTH domain
MAPEVKDMAQVDFGTVLRRIRHDRGETLEQVSEATGLSVAMLSRVERGERLPSPESVETLAAHFGLPAEYLMSETIANRMLNRYGLRSSSLAAERLSRESPEAAALGWAADTPLESRSAEPGRPAPERRQADRPPQRYGAFQEMDMLAALSAIEGPGAGARAGRPPPRSPAAPEPSPAQPASPHLDPATEQVLRAATASSRAAATLAMQESRSLSAEARLELLREVETLAGQAAEALRTLASDDPDPRVRAAAGEALHRLGRR